MADIILDLSGRSGLADNFYGDADTITPLPNLRIAKKETDLVSGLFNPYLRDGYLAPVTTTNTDLTLDTSTTTQFGCVEYDHENQDVYWGDRLKSIYTGTSLTDTSLTLVDTLDNIASFPDKQYDELHDLQIYQLNGVRKLFFVGKGLPTNDGPVTSVASTANADSYTATAMSIVPFASTKPTVVDTERNFTSGAGTTTTQSFTVPSGTNQALIVVAQWTTNASAPTATFNGDSMTTELTSTLGPSVRVFKLANPDVTTANVVVTWGSSVADRLVYIILVSDTDQTQILDADQTRESAPTTTSIDFTMPYTHENALNMVAAYSDDVMTQVAGNGTDYYDTTNNWGSDLLVVSDESGYGLQVGYSDLPATTFTSSNTSWLSTEAVNGFNEAMDGDYAFMRVADNGFAYIFNDHHVHKIDGGTTGGETGTVTRDVLLFPDYFTITDAVDYRSRLFIAVHQYPVSVADTSINTFTGRCGLYIWNRISTQLSAADYIELPGVREIKKIFASPDGQLKLIAISDTGLVELRQFGYNDSGGVVFPVVKTLGLGAYPQFPDGLTTAGDKVMWAANDGKIYCNKDDYVTQIYQIKAPGTTTSTLESNLTTGAVFYGNGDETGSTGYRSNKQALTFSYLDGSTDIIEKIYPFDLKNGSNSSQASAQGDVYTAVMFIPTHSVVRNVRVYNAPVVGSGSTEIATVKLYFNQSTTVGMTKTVTKDEAKRGYVDFKINKPYIHAIQVEIEWSTSINLDGDIYLPSTAVISHEPTTGQSPDNG